MFDGLERLTRESYRLDMVTISRQRTDRELRVQSARIWELLIGGCGEFGWFELVRETVNGEA